MNKKSVSIIKNNYDDYLFNRQGIEGKLFKIEKSELIRKTLNTLIENYIKDLKK